MYLHQSRCLSSVNCTTTFCGDRGQNFDTETIPSTEGFVDYQVDDTLKTSLKREFDLPSTIYVNNEIYIDCHVGYLIKAIKIFKNLVKLFLKK